MKTLLTLALILIPTASALTSTIGLAWTDPEADGKPRSSWERQQEAYRQHGYDTRQNGPLDETVAEDRRRQEKQREEDRQRQERRQNQDRYGNQCRTLYGC